MKRDLGNSAGPSGAVAVSQKPATVPHSTCATPNITELRTKRNARNVSSEYKASETIVIRSG